MRSYEILFIVRPDIPEEEMDGVVEPLKNVVTAEGGTVDKVDRWGKRKLAYRVRRCREGHYILLQFSTSKGAETVKELERRLRVSDAVIKFLTVRIDEELKQLEKLKKKREKRAIRKPPSTPREEPAAPSAPAPPSAPAAPLAEAVAKDKD